MTARDPGARRRAVPTRTATVTFTAFELELVCRIAGVVEDVVKLVGVRLTAWRRIDQKLRRARDRVAAQQKGGAS